MAEPVSGNAEGGLADNGARQPGNAEETLLGAFEGAAAGAAGAKPEAKPGTGDAAAGGTGTGGGTEAKLAPWTEQLPPELKGNPAHAAKLAPFQKVGDLVTAFLELEGKAGAAIPGADAAPEAVAAFWEKAGRPKTAEGYSFAGDKARDGDVFAQAAFAANLTAAQAEAAWKGLNGMGEQRAEALKNARDRQLRETAAALSAEYGPRYGEKMELLARGLAAAGPGVSAALKQAGLYGNPEIVRAFIACGQMTAESGAARGGSAGAALQSVLEGGTFDDYENVKTKGEH
ncbi:MAG: hypothetical protein LBD08_03565 [Treponema sp.]|jgi:hypothetical protein|nr:hypothetical protein [Treponema sp.]